MRTRLQGVRSSAASDVDKRQAGYRQAAYFSTSNSAGTDTFFWTNFQNPTNNNGLGIYMNNSVSYVSIDVLAKNSGISVRCIRN